VISLPPAHRPDRYRITVVCSGNICRSPTADVVLNQLVVRAGLEDRVHVDSCGLGGWHVGDGMDRRSAAHLAEAGYDPSGHAARQIPRTWWDSYDLALAMDGGHLRDLRAQLPTAGRHDHADLAARVRLFGDFDPVDPGREISDPYYGGPKGFEEVLAVVERTSVALVAALTREIGAP
jgi:low molecular weight protein-tyrosine phosphatase